MLGNILATVLCNDNLYPWNALAPLKRKKYVDDTFAIIKKYADRSSEELQHRLNDNFFLAWYTCNKNPLEEYHFEGKNSRVCSYL